MVSPSQEEAYICGNGRRPVLYVKVCTWNVEGLTDIKIYEICNYMEANGIHIACVQETRQPKSDSYCTETGFQVLLSGGTGAKEWAGVGFIVSPEFKKNVVSSCPFSNRIASITFKVSGVKHALICVYAPHNGRPTEEKLQFYEDLGMLYDRISVNGPKTIAGDMNARLGARLCDEEQVIGDFTFGSEAKHPVPLPNRLLLLEFCLSRELMVGNTFFDHPVEKLATFREPGVPPMSAMDSGRFAMLDLYLLSDAGAQLMQDIVSDRTVSLASQHFPVLATMKVEAQDKQSSKHRPKRDWNMLKDPTVRRDFVAMVNEQIGQLPNTMAVGLNVRWGALKEAIRVASDVHIKPKPAEAKRPWISKATLDLIERRTKAHMDQDWQLEKALRKEVHRSARSDRGRWLEDMVQYGDWNSIRRLRRGRKVNQSRLQNSSGRIVETDERAETFAEHLETIQWRVRHVTALPPHTNGPLRSPLNVQHGRFSHVELRKAIQKLRSGKAFKGDDVPIECLKAFANEAGPSFQWLLDFCNDCWEKKEVPEDWACASVCMIFKKGDPSDCENYRPICILSVACKVYAAMLKARIIDAGALNHLWESQFGFRPGHCTEDAIFAARRHIELACAQRDGKVTLLALDWKKAFDSVNVEALLNALSRFGIVGEMLDMISGLLRHRTFSVSDNSCNSASRRQLSGVSQGCTLSPLLFIITMTVLMHDAVSLLSAGARASYEKGALTDLIYADDTLLIGTNSEYVNEFLHAVCLAGHSIGMELHWGKFQLLSVRSVPDIATPSGEKVTCASQINYLGAALSAEGGCDNELARRIGMAKADFLSLCKIWRHSALPWQRKVRIFVALVESKLMYGLSTLCLTVAQLRRLDGFQCRCLRSILGIKSAYLSRVANERVWHRAGHPQATELLRTRQLRLLGKVLRAPIGSPLQVPSLIPGTTTPATERYVRRVGRPRKEWIGEIMAFASRSEEARNRM